MGGAVMAVILNASTSSGLVTTADNSGQFAFQSNGVQFNPLLTAATAQASTSGTSIDFTGIPSWVKRITVLFSGVSLSGTANFLIQIGAGSVTTSGYSSSAAYGGSATTSTSGFVVIAGSAAAVYTGIMTIATLGSNAWVESSMIRSIAAGTDGGGVGSVSLSGSLDRVRITTTNGTDTFDAGTINILYE